MKNLTKLAILAAIAGGAYYVYKNKTEQQAAEVAVDDDDLFEGDFEGAEGDATEEPAPKKFDVYKQKASEIAKKTAEKASDIAKVVVEKAGEAKDYVGKKVEEAFWSAPRLRGKRFPAGTGTSAAPGWTPSPPP